MGETGIGCMCKRFLDRYIHTGFASHYLATLYGECTEKSDEVRQTNAAMALFESSSFSGSKCSSMAN